MAQEVLLSISLIIAIAAIATIIARLIRQPPIIAYIATGIISGPLILDIIGIGGTQDLIQLFAHIGVAFLLFIVGLSLDLRVLREVGWISFFAGSIQIIITALLGFLISMSLGFSLITSLYICIAFSFSSTVVVVKILSDKKEIDTVHGRIALGILIVQDFVAAAILMIIPLITTNGGVIQIFSKFVIALSLIVLILLFSHFILNRLMNYIAISQETLFLSGIAWALVLSTLFFKLGFSLEIGALIAGISIASSKYTLELGGKIKPLRDFFIVLFFVFFGSQLIGPITLDMLKTAVLFSLFIFIFKPLIVMVILRISGYKKKTNFFVGLSLAQISEFSLIILLLGFTTGHVQQQIISLAVLIAMITIGISSYTIYYSLGIFDKISGFLNIFEGKRHRLEKTKKQSYDIVLFGYHRIGYKILQELKELKSSFVIIDYNPKVILSLTKQKINCIYGDAGDEEFLREIPLDKAKIVISTIPIKSDTLMIKEVLKESNPDAVFIATAEHPSIALDFYKSGVDYVIVPHHLGGEYAAKMIKEAHINLKKYKHAGRKHRGELSKTRDEPSFS